MLVKNVSAYHIGRPVRDGMLEKSLTFVETIIMANTYTQIHIHAVFAVQNRLSLIQNQWQEELYQYI